MSGGTSVSETQADMAPLAHVRILFGAPFVTLMMIFVYLAAMMSWELFTNSNRHLYEVIGGVLLLTIPVFIIASMAQLGSYIMLPAFSYCLLRLERRVSLWWLLAATPVLALLAWYGYDYLVPNYRWYTDESPDFVHGISIERYLRSLGFEVVVAAQRSLV